MDNIPDLLSESILDTYGCISVKVNYAVGEDVSNNIPDEFYSVSAYLNDQKLDVVYSTAGIHLNGKNKRPHIHYHLIVKSMPSGTFQSSNSMHRKRWLSKEGNNVYSLDNVSISFPKKEDPVWQHLAYPFKEGFIVKQGVKGLLKTQVDFLMEYGKNLYQVSLGNRARQDACENRKKLALNNLAELCKNNISQFNTLKEMMIWLDDSYIATLELEDYPDPKHYKTNCQKIAVNLGKLKYSDIV